MDAGNTLINTVTYYAVYITDDNSGSFDANGWTIITFPSSDYTTNTISSSVCNISCSKSSNNYNVSNSLFISNALTINITNILNPGRSGGRDYSYAIYNSAGVITDQQIVSTLTFTPGSLQSSISQLYRLLGWLLPQQRQEDRHNDCYHRAGQSGIGRWQRLYTVS